MFIPEKAALRPILVIISVYLVSLMAFAALITLNRTDDVALFFTYLLSFGVACLVNFFVISRVYKELSEAKHKQDIHVDIANIDGHVLGLVDRNLNCVDINGKVNSQFRTVAEMLFSIGVNQDEIEKFESYIKSPHTIFTDRIKSNATSLVLFGLRYSNKDYDVLLLSYKPSESLYCLKMRDRLKENVINVYDQMPIAYFQVDEHGYVHKANLKMAQYLGMKVSDLNKSNLVINDIIDTLGVDLSLKYSQSIVKLKDSVDPYMLVTSNNAANDESEDSKHCFVLKIAHSEINQLGTNFEDFCINYSWQTFFEGSPYPVCILDEDGNIKRMNKTMVLTIDRKESLMNTEFAQLFDKGDSEIITNYLSDLSISTDIENPMPQLRLHGGKKVLEVYIGKVLDFEGKLYGFVVRLADITQQRQLEENLSHAQRMQTIGQLVGSVAHDFNNILTAISGFCDLLLLRHGMGDPSFSNIMQIKQSADRASSLVKRLLAFSRKQTLQLQAISPIELFSEFNPLIQRLIGTRIKFNQHIDHDVWEIKVDLVQMEQVVLNLVVNAHHAMGNDGTLNISVENFNITDDTEFIGFMTPAGERLPSSGEYVKICVEDTGYGISEEDMHKIFEPFFTTKPDISGTGLGLSTVYGVVRQSNAYIFVKSAIGQGTTFMLLFPKAERENRPEVVPLNITAEPVTITANDTIGRGTIVLVEDEDAIRTFAKNVLTNKGYDVVDFPSAKNAFESLSAKPIKFDLLVTDVLMPEMNGPALVTKLKESIPNIKVIFISGYAEEAFTAEYGDKRDFHFLPKPFSLKQLLITVKEVIELNDGKNAA